MCPTAIEIELEGRRLRLARNQGEFFVLLCLVARFHELHADARRYTGFSAKWLSESALEAFPRRAKENQSGFGRSSLREVT